MPKNPNEAAYVGGKKHWIDSIKNSGPGELLVWRQPEEDFNTNSVLTVMPGEEAVFIKNGTVQQIFENGRYKLSTENYPVISRLRNAFSGGISTFNCVVYFVRKADSEEIFWGTDSPIQVRDKVWGIRTDVKARGAYKIRIDNSAKFLEKLIGNNVFIQTQQEMTKYFQTQFQGKIKTVLSAFLNVLDQELIGIDAYLEEMSEKIEPKIDDIFGEYGVKCVNFSLSGMDVDTSKYDQLDQSQIALIEKTRMEQGKTLEFQTKKAGLQILGDDWLKIQGVELLNTLAQNPAGGTAAAGAGIGMGIGAAGIYGTIAQQIFAPVANGFGQPVPMGAPPQQPQAAPSGRFAQKPADTTPASQPARQEDVFAQLSELKSYLDNNVITQDDYDKFKSEILSKRFNR